MNVGRTLFAQVMDFIPWTSFERIVARYGGDLGVRKFRCNEQFRVMAFAQMTYRESLRDIEACLQSRSARAYHLGISGRVTRTNLAYANEHRDWRIYADFAQVLIRRARNLYRQEPFGLELDETVYALDSTTIDLCLSLFPWAQFRRRKSAVKMHTLLDLRGSVPTTVYVTSGAVHDVNILDELAPEAGAFYLMDRGYLDFQRLYGFHLACAFFVTRAKQNTQFYRRSSRPVSSTSGLRSDQTIRLTGPKTARLYPDPLRRIHYCDPEQDTRLIFLTNNFLLPALTVTQLYRARWQVELFFRWIKQHLRIKAFYGTSENAVKTQVWIAISVYVLIAIVKKQLQLDLSLYKILQILSISIFEKTPILEGFSNFHDKLPTNDPSKQLNLFEL